jgi:hypothetical protein
LRNCSSSWRGKKSNETICILTVFDTKGKLSAVSRVNRNLLPVFGVFLSFPLPL